MDREGPDKKGTAYKTPLSATELYRFPRVQVKFTCFYSGEKLQDQRNHRSAY